MPTPAARAAWPFRSVARSSVLEGMQPQFVHSPPISSFSISAIDLPAFANVLTATSPPGPAPRTTTSNVSVISLLLSSSCVGGNSLRGGGCVTPPAVTVRPFPVTAR